VPTSDWEPPEKICVIDTQIVIAIKNRLRVQEQWPMLTYLGELVEDGWVTFPKQVARELEVARHPDGPGIWAVSAQHRRRYREASDESMANVLGVAPGLFDPNEERNQADPYVVALAYELRERWPDRQVCVATENTVDHPPLVSPATACELLQLPRLDFVQFLAWLPALDPQAQEIVTWIFERLLREQAAEDAADED
jgi:hypothetical protein